MSRDPLPPCKYCGADWLTDHQPDCPSEVIRRLRAENEQLRSSIIAGEGRLPDDKP